MNDQPTRPAQAPQADYFSQLQAEMVRVLPTRSKREKAAFAALDVEEQAWRFMNWQSRLVHPHPRQVNKADGFDKLAAVQVNQTEVERLLASIARGDNVTVHLSDDINQGYCLRPPGRKHGPDFDLLLNEWGIHHLHIGPTRGSELLYAIFGRGVAFILAVAPHGAWTSRQLVEATVRSWPNQKLFVALNGMPSRDHSENEHKALRKAGVTTLPVVNDKLWMSSVTLGISTALVSTRVSMEVGQMLQHLHNATDHPEHLACQLMDNAAIIGASWPTSPVISVRWIIGPDRYGFCFVEEASEAGVFI